MFVYKNKYFLIIESTKDIDLSNIKNTHKFNIIYRKVNKIENIDKLIKFRKLCNSKKINFFVYNDIRLLSDIRANGLYISAFNQNLRLSLIKKFNFKIVGSAHNIKEINIKISQGCSEIFYSRLFKTSYSNKKSFLGLVKYNLMRNMLKRNLTPLGGIKLTNINKLKSVRCNSIAIMSEIKKKPAIISRLF